MNQLHLKIGKLLHLVFFLKKNKKLGGDKK